MKTKRILAIILAVLMTVTCFASCRTKDENAFTFTYGDKTVNIRTALYMCFLIDADIEFQNEAVETAEENGTEYEDYTELSYEDKDYETWVKDEAKKAAQKYAYAEIEFERLGYTIGEDEQAYIDYYAEMQWDGSEGYQGISEVYEANGVSYNTYKLYFENSYWKQEMVYNFYIEEASEDEEETTTTVAQTATAESETTAETTTEKALDPEIEKLRGSLRPSDKKINSSLKNNFVAVDIIDVSFIDDEGAEKDEETLKAQLSLLKDYAKAYEDGTDFATIYASYQEAFGITSDSTSTDSTAEYEQVLLSAKANKSAGNGDEADENFAEALKIKSGEAKVIENDDCYALVVRKDILKDSDSSGTSFKDSYISSAINVLVEDTYETDIVDKLVAEFECKENSSAIKYYSPLKIDYLDETTTTVATTE